MSKHNNKIKELSASELAELFSKTTYEYQLKMFTELANIYYNDAIDDQSRGYIKLSSRLYSLSYNLESIIDVLKDIWRICKDKTEVK
jgi:hypothetical protein